MFCSRLTFSPVYIILKGFLPLKIHRFLKKAQIFITSLSFLFIFYYTILELFNYNVNNLLLFFLSYAVAHIFSNKVNSCLVGINNFLTVHYKYLICTKNFVTRNSFVFLCSVRTKKNLVCTEQIFKCALIKYLVRFRSRCLCPLDQGIGAH